MPPSDITLQDLVQTGLLFEGDVLHAKRGESFFFAKITENGWIRISKRHDIEDNLHDNPSGAGVAVLAPMVRQGKIKGTSVNGWKFWSVIRLRSAPNNRVSGSDIAYATVSILDDIVFVLLDDLRKKLRLRRSR